MCSDVKGNYLTLKTNYICKLFANKSMPSKADRNMSSDTRSFYNLFGYVWIRLDTQFWIRLDTFGYVLDTRFGYAHFFWIRKYFGYVWIRKGKIKK